MIHLAETSTKTAERVDAFFLGYMFAYLDIDIVRDDFSFVDFEKSTAKLNISTRYRHHFSYKFYHSVVADPDPEGFVKTKEGFLDERSLLEWARSIEIISPDTTALKRMTEKWSTAMFAQKFDNFKKLEYEGQQYWANSVFATGYNFPLRSESPTGIVYLVGCDRSQTVKVGYTEREVKTRLRELQTGYHFPLRVLATREGTKAAEGKLLNRFRHLGVKGEWFYWDDSITKIFNL